MKDFFLWLAWLCTNKDTCDIPDDSPLFEYGEFIAWAVAVIFFACLGGLIFLAASL